MGGYLGDLAHHLSADHQSLNEGARSHKGAGDHHLHLSRSFSERPERLRLLGHTLQVVLACSQHTHPAQVLENIKMEILYVSSQLGLVGFSITEADHTYETRLVRPVEEPLQEPGPEFVEHLLQVDVGASVIVPQICVQVSEDLGILGVQGAPGGGEGFLQTDR